MERFNFFDRFFNGRKPLANSPAAEDEQVDEWAYQYWKEAKLSGMQSTLKNIPEEVKSKLERVLFKNDAATLGAILKGVLSLNQVKWEVLVSENKVSLSLKGNLRGEKNIEKIYLDIYQAYNEASPRRGSYAQISDIGFGPFSLSITVQGYQNTIIFDVEQRGSLSEKDLQRIAEIFEQHVLSNANLESNQEMTEDTISERLGLSQADIVVIEEKQVDITMFSEEISHLDFWSLLKTVNQLGNSTFTSFRKKYIHVSEDLYMSAWWEQKFHFSVITEDNAHPVEFDIIIKKHSMVVQVKLPNFGFNRKFLSQTLVPIVKELRQMSSAKNQESITEYLMRMGVRVYENTQSEHADLNKLYEREGFVGYEDIKEKIESGVINAWKHKSRYEEIANLKFKNVKDIVPNAVLFEWPAGTGKTTLARIIGSHLNYPFVYIPLNSFMSKWYGEAESQLALILEKIGELAKQSGWVVIMIDEIDEIGGNRENSHEATGKITGVLLKKLDGMERISNILLVGATNRKDSLDPALISRFKYSQYFRLPNEIEISKIVSYYLPELWDIPPTTLAPFAWKISGRNIKNICEDVARIAIQNEIDGKDTDLLEVFTKSLVTSIDPH